MPSKTEKSAERCQGQFPENAGQRSPGKRSAPGALSAQHRRDISRVRPLALPGLREKVSGTVSLERGQTPEKRSRVHLDSRKGVRDNLKSIARNQEPSRSAIKAYQPSSGSRQSTMARRPRHRRGAVPADPLRHSRMDGEPRWSLGPGLRARHESIRHARLARCRAVLARRAHFVPRRTPQAPLAGDMH